MIRQAFFFVASVVFSSSLAISPAYAGTKLPVYFDLGPQLTEEFSGTYEFKYKRFDFVQESDSAFKVRSSGDQSPVEARIFLREGFLYWVLDWSHEEWYLIKQTLQRGDQWHHRLRGWDQVYRVVQTDLTVSVPAGDFQHCTKVTISWMAHEHDMTGPQKEILYLAPRLGIIKREVWSNREKWHEEVLTKYNSK